MVKGQKPLPPPVGHVVLHMSLVKHIDCAVNAVVEAFTKYEVVDAIIPFLNHSGVVVDWTATA